MTNRALLIGINNYPGAELRGCINDIEDMAAFIESKFTFADDSITKLTDSAATADGIRAALATFIKGVVPGDRLLLHFSGHGAQIDGVDCCCPQDFDWSPEHAIDANEFASTFAAIPVGVEFIWVSDSCHSGDLAREMPSLGDIVRNRYRKPRLYPNDNTSLKRTATPQLSRAIAHLNGGFISGCRSDQTSADAEFGGRPNGALTYYLLQTLEAVNEATESLTTVVANTAAALQFASYEQQPQVHGTDTILAKPFLAISIVQSDVGSGTISADATGAGVGEAAAGTGAGTGIIL